MRYCEKCGNQIDDLAVMCPKCGASTRKNYEDRPKKSNTLAIIGFILSFIFPAAGFVCSIMGLKKVYECNSGHGLAVAGIIISIANFVIGLILNMAAMALYM